MKKRILSAALALAMVLTLLPATIIPAFAADWTTVGGDNPPSSANYPTSATDPTTKNYYEKDANGRVTKTVTVTRCNATNNTTGQKYGHWYWQDNQGGHSQSPRYMEVTSGIVAGTSGSGQWYASVADYTNIASDGSKKVRGAFTALGTDAINLSGYSDTSLTLAIANETSVLTIPSNLTTLNITGKFQDTPAGEMDRGHVGAISVARDTQVASGSGTNTGLSITAENIIFDGAITLEGRANTLRLKNCAVIGDITMDGETITTLGGATPNSWGAQTINAENSTFGATISITNSNGGGITFKDSKMTGGTNTVTFTSDGGTINVSGASALGVITVTPRTKTGQYASVTISGGSVQGVTQGEVAGNGNAIRITVTGSNTSFGAIDAGVNGTVSITDADGTSVKVDKGTLTIGGSGVDISGAVTLGGDDKTTLNMNASGSTFGSIVTPTGKGVNLTISSWEGRRWTDGGNNYGTLNLDNYSGKKVTGGSFAMSATPTHANVTNFGSKDNLGWFDSKLLFFVNSGTDTRLDLYKNDELARAISDVGTAIVGASKGYINALGQYDTANVGKSDFITLKNGDVVWAYITYDGTTPLILPDRINNVTITNWLAEENHNVKVPAGTETNVPFLGHELVLNATGTSAAVGRITKATAAVAGTDGVVQNQNVTVKLEGNNISVSGAVTPNAGGIATVKVDLETDVVRSGTGPSDTNSGSYLVIRDVLIDYNVNTKKVSFNVIQPTAVVEAGILVQDGMLVLNYGTGEKYTVSANLTESASSLGIMVETEASDNIQVTFGGKLSSWTAKQKEELTKKLADPANTSFTYGANQAMQQAINAAQATITSNNTVDGWITSAKNTIWRQGFKSPTTSKNTNYGYMDKLAPNTGTFNANTDSGTEINAKFAKAYIVPYLVVNVTDYNGTNGTMTATLTPYFRVDVSAPDNYVADVAYTVQQGKPLTLTGDMFGTVSGTTVSNQIKVKFNDTALNGKVMHQDGKYAYTSTAGQAEWSITHIGANGTLGTVEINSNPGLVEIDGTAAAAIANRVPTVDQLGCKYDTLQAAIDDTVRGLTAVNDDGIGSAPAGAETMDTVVIDGRYTGSCAITMSGMSRKVLVKAKGQQDVTCNTQNVDVQNTGGFTYIVQLKQDNVPAGTVAIGVTSGVTGGTASLSLRSAKAGQTVTVTLIPDNGRTVQSVTAQTNTGVTVTLTPTGNANEYSFTVPTGATSITVTPSFKTGVTASKVAVNVANTSTGSVTTTAASTQNQVDPGTTVGVTTYPATGYRTMGVSVTGATATRVSDNYFTFVAPAGAAAVTVTPSYDRDNGTKFSDVWSTEYYSDAVAWAVSKGITNGQSTYQFGSSMSCSRAEMVTFLWRAAGKPSVTGVSNPFTDVAPGSYYYDAVLWAVSKGITNGLSSTYFGVSKPVTRAEMATFLYRYEGAPATGANSGFVDVPANQWYSKAVTWAVGKGVTNGKTTTTFAPSDACKRAEVVTFLYRDINGVRA